MDGVEDSVQFLPNSKNIFLDTEPASRILSDHPLLEKFQITLRDHLYKANNLLENEISDVDFNLAQLNGKREEIGSNLYDLQQEIERQSDTLDKYNNRIQNTFEKRIELEECHRTLQKELKTQQENYADSKRIHNQRLLEISKLQMLERNIDKWCQEMRNDVEVSKRVISKDKQEKQRKSEEKKQMDFLLLNLEMEVRHRENESNHLMEQIKEHAKRVEILNVSLADANADLNALQSEHKRLIGSWNDVAYAIQSRDKTLAQTNNKLIEENENIKLIQTKIDGTKKSALKEMEKNENLEQFKQRLSNDSNHINKQLEKLSKEQFELINGIEEMATLIKTTDVSLSKSTTENYIHEGQLNSLRREHERQLNKKIQLEEEILNVLQDQITTDQASKTRAKNVRDIQNQRRELEMSMFTTEEQLSEILFELEKLKGIVSRSKCHIDDLTKDKITVEKKADEYGNELNTVKKSIQQKLKAFDALNKELAQLIHTAGGTEKDPTELKVNDLERSIAELENEIRDDQNLWLRLQSNIVRMSEKHTKQLNDAYVAKKQLQIIEQKSIKLNEQLNNVDKQEQDLMRQIKNLNTKLDKLSAKLYEKKQNNQNEEVQCRFIHLNMMDKLKANELSVLQTEEEINSLGIEIEELKVKVMDKHREALSWETKWKMVTEAKRQRDIEYAKGSENGIMKSEIHRMKVRLSQLKRAQEKLVQDMENCVQHRDHIFDVAIVRSKLKTIKPQPMNTLQHRVNEVKCKLKQIAMETISVEKQIADVLCEKEHIEVDLIKINETIDNERLQYILLQNEIEQAILLKQENLENIVRAQHRAKRYRSLTLAKQLPKHRNETIVNGHMEKHTEVNEHLICVLSGLLSEFPDQRFNINLVLQTLNGPQ